MLQVLGLTLVRVLSAGICKTKGGHMYRQFRFFPFTEGELKGSKIHPFEEQNEIHLAVVKALSSLPSPERALIEPPSVRQPSDDHPSGSIARRDKEIILTRDEDRDLKDDDSSAARGKTRGEARGNKTRRKRMI